MKKPGPPAAGRVMSGGVVRFREGNGSCVHRLGMTGGGLFCRARCRVYFDHSLSQVSLLRRNLITVFLCVNNLGEFFSLAIRRRRERGDAPDVRAMDAPGMAAVRACNRREKKHLVSKCFVRSTHALRASRTGRRTARRDPERMRNGAIPACVRDAKKLPRLRVAPPRMRGFARTDPSMRAPLPTRGARIHGPLAAPRAACRRRIADASATCRRRIPGASTVRCVALDVGVDAPRSASSSGRCAWKTKKAAEFRGLPEVRRELCDQSSICSA